MTVRRRESSIIDFMRELKSAYELGREGRFVPRLIGVDPSGSDADFHLRNETEFFRAIERARVFDAEDTIVGQGVTRLCNLVLQDGPKFDVKTKNKELNQILWERFDQWANDPRACHSRRMLGLTSIAKLTLRRVIVDGDVLHLPLRDSGALEPIEAHRLRTPRYARKNIIHGVDNDPVSGAPRRYFVIPGNYDDPQNTQKKLNPTEMKVYPAFHPNGSPAVFHVFNPRRFSQSRGISAFNPIKHSIGMHNDLHFANLVRAQMAACVTLIKEVGLDFGGGAAEPTGERTSTIRPDGSVAVFEGLSPGMTIRGLPGEKWKLDSPNVPNPEFYQHAMLILCYIAVNLDIPVQVLLLDPTKTNFSGWRGAMQMAKYGFKEMQRWMIERFYRPVYNWKVDQFVAEDPALARLAENMGPDLYSCTIHPPTWEYIEPLKDAEADARRIDKVLASPRMIAAERGLEWEDLVRDYVQDRALLVEAACAAAERINQRFSFAGLDFRELIGWEMPKIQPAGKAREE